jgi:hypothetical protein
MRVRRAHLGRSRLLKKVRSRRRTVRARFGKAAVRFLVGSSSRSGSLVEHDLLRKPLHTFPDHAFAANGSSSAETGLSRREGRADLSRRWQSRTLTRAHAPGKAQTSTVAAPSRIFLIGT